MQMNERDRGTTATLSQMEGDLRKEIDVLRKEINNLKSELAEIKKKQ